MAPKMLHLKYHANYPVSSLYDYDDIDAWSEWYPGELTESSKADIRRELKSFRTMAPTWLKRGKITAPIIVIDSDHGSVIGDGRGRVSVSIGMGWDRIPTVIAKSKKSEVSGSIIVVDVQPEYKDSIYFDISSFCEYLDENYGKRAIAILYNGSETVGETTEDELKQWLFEYGFEHAYEVEYYDKGYGFFRFCMDEGADYADLVRLIKFMKEKDIVDSRTIADEELWDEFINMYKEHSVDEIRELLEFSDDMINIPDLMEWLEKWTSKYSGKIELCGGAAEQCLAEVELALDANDQEYSVNYNWIYG